MRQWNSFILIEFLVLKSIRVYILFLRLSLHPTTMAQISSAIDYARLQRLPLYLPIPNVAIARISFERALISVSP
jgi:hypothetical protein